MKELDISIDKGGIEKKIIISSGVISFDNTENSINTKHKISTIVIAGNGDFAPPFEKGSKVLRDIRSSSNKKLQNWKLVIPLQQNEFDFHKLSLNFITSDLIKSDKSNWGIWYCESDEADEFPNILLCNIPLWLLSRQFKNNQIDIALYENLLSQTYRTIFSGIGAVCSFQLKGSSDGNHNCLVLSDLGNNLIDRNLISKISESEYFEDEIYKVRIRVFTQVLSDWLVKTDFYNKAIICYGDGVRMDLVERAWDIQASESKDDLNEFGDALVLRNKNAQALKYLSNTTAKKEFQNALKMAFETFSIPNPSLAADLIQSRTLVEAISLEICKKYNLNINNGNLFAYVQRIEESKKISPWVTSYLHVIRQLGNEAAHYKTEIQRRPEKPVGKDLIVIHATLSRILSFCIDEDL